jgi:hypothetical protein
MKIQDSQSMLDRLNSGGGIMLNEKNQLETQSAAGRFFQKIGDAFRSLTPAGRAAIETRVTNLHMAMASLLPQDTLVNPVQGEISRPGTQAGRNALAMRLGLAQALHKFPPEARAAARSLGLQLLRLPGVLGPGNSAEIRDKTLAVMNKILNDKVVCNALLRCDYARTHAQLEPMLPEIADHLSATFMAQKDLRVNQDGIYRNYLRDAPRDLRGINGQAPDTANAETITAELKALVPNEKVRGFLSVTASQDGLAGSLKSQLTTPGKIKDNPDMSGFNEMQAKGLSMETPLHKYDIHVEGRMARVTLEMEFLVRPSASMQNLAKTLGIGFDGAAVGSSGLHLGGGRYTLEMELDIEQDMEGKDIPDFTLVRASRAPVSAPPIPVQPPADQAPAGR